MPICLFTLLLVLFTYTTRLPSMENVLTDEVMETFFLTPLGSLSEYLSKIDINGRFDTGDTLLHILATSEHHVDQAKLLLQNQAKVDIPNNSGFRPLDRAVQSGCLPMVRLLLEYGADPNTRPTNTGACQSPLNSAASLELLHGLQRNSQLYDTYTKIVKALKEKDKKRYDSAFLNAINRRKILNFENLLKGGVDPNSILTYHTSGNSEHATVAHTSSVLHLCIKRRLNNFVETLLRKEVNVNTQDNYGDTPLHTALVERLPQVLIEQLIRAGAKVNTPGRGGLTPLHCAYNEALAQLLLDNGAEVNIFAEDNSTPLHHAVARNASGVARLLLEKGAQVEAQEASGATPLFIAAVVKEDLDLIKLLVEEYKALVSTYLMNAVEQKIMIHKRRNESQQAIFAIMLYLNKKRNLSQDAEDKTIIIGPEATIFPAIRNAKLSKVQKLLKQNIDVNMRVYMTVEDFFTQKAIVIETMPLHYAVWYASEEIADELIKAKAGINNVDGRGDAPLHIALARQATGLVRILLNAGASVTQPGRLKLTPLHYAYNKEVALLLLDKNPDINAESEHRATPLHCATQGNRCDVVEVLLNKKAMLELRDIGGYSALRVAVEETRNVNIICLLLKHGAAVDKNIVPRLVDILTETVDSLPALE